jgi:hypothetical protein
MKRIIMAAGLLLALSAASMAPANAVGCLKGAVVRGVAGHVVGHHGLLGAGAGCLIGRHEANKRAREQTQQSQSYIRATARAEPELR